ncbi:UDP-glucose 4-epimerase [Azospirillum fermentarium]|nr:UDP-glucose 4-epimerase [Azospirillum fermentarium]
MTAFGHPPPGMTSERPAGTADTDGIAWHIGDFTDRGRLVRALGGCTVAYHLIGSTSPARSNAAPAEDVADTVIGTIAFLDAAVAAGVKRVVFVSSGGTVYGVQNRLPIAEDFPTDPICAYGINKLAIEKYLHLYHHLHGLDYCVLRVANPFGEGQVSRRQQGVVAAFAAAAAHGEPLVIWGDGSIVRDYVHIDDVTAALIQAGTVPALAERVINIGSGEGRSVLDVADAMEAAAGRPLVRDFRPGRPVDVPAVVLDITRARRVLEWSPQVPWREAVARAYRFHRDHAVPAVPVP